MFLKGFSIPCPTCVRCESTLFRFTDLKHHRFHSTAWRNVRVGELLCLQGFAVGEVLCGLSNRIVGRWFRATLLAIFVVLLALSLGFPSEALGPLTWLDGTLPRAAGWALLAASLIWVVVAQAQMDSSWRIGIDAASQPPLVSRGAFRISRNPIFLGMRASLLGLFLVLPNTASLAILLLGEVLMQVQVRLEEAHLSAAFGEDYDAYRSTVRRWL